MVTRSRFAFSLILLIAVAALAGCGGGSNSSSTSSTASTGSTSSAAQSGGAIVEVASNPTLGSILVDAEGQTLYIFQKDSGGKSSCSGSCAKVWPPEVTTSSPKAGSGASASKLGTVKRSDGTMQVTYAGHPLYTYTADTSAGQVNGNGINSYGGIWNAVQPSGTKAPTGSSSGGSGSASKEGGTGASTSSSGGYGY
jgi:predicted lipoprotein with Yx(FWY)xxD motif